MIILALILIINVGLSLVPIFSDCDEVYNYWDPFYTMCSQLGVLTGHGPGFQPWEYSPEHPLRSYMPLLVPFLATKTLSTVCQLTSFGIYRGVTICLAVLSSLGQWALITCMSKHVFSRGPWIGVMFSLIYSTLPGNFVSLGFLPNSISMMLGFVSLDGFYHDNLDRVLLCGVLTFWFGWIYSLFGLVLPLLDLVRRTRPQKVLRLVIKHCFIFIGVGLFQLMVDWWFYNRLVWTQWNTFMYNVMDGQSTLFGTDPWYYYLANLTLNMHLVFWMAVIFPLAMMVRTETRSNLVGKHLVVWTSLLAYLILFSFQRHKEERFMFTIYPFVICIFMVILNGWIPIIRHPGWIVLGWLGIVLISCLRLWCLHRLYYGPVHLYKEIHQNPDILGNKTVLCTDRKSVV